MVVSYLWPELHPDSNTKPKIKKQLQFLVTA